jgi:hypothetical protein
MVSEGSFIEANIGKCRKKATPDIARRENLCQARYLGPLSDTLPRFANRPDMRNKQ